MKTLKVKLFSLILAFSSGSLGNETVVIQGQATSGPTGGNTIGAGANDPSVHDSSKKSGGSNSMAQMINTAVGAGLIAKGNAINSSCECGAGIPLIMLGIQGLMQAGSNGGSAGSAAATMGKVNGYGNPFGLTGYDNGLVDKGTLNKLNTQIADGSLGVTYDGKTNTFKTKDGKTYSGNDFSSAEGLANAGFSPSQISDMTKAVASLEKESMDKAKKLGLDKINAGFESGGGGGFSNNPPPQDPDYADIYGRKGTNGDAGKIREPAASVAGMTKDFQGVPVGVAQDNIFSMMKRRYQVKDKQDNFLNDTDIKLKK